jgi:hypothetical protein
MPIPIRELGRAPRRTRCRNEGFSSNVQDINDVRGGVIEYAVQGKPPIEETQGTSADQTEVPPDSKPSLKMIAPTPSPR